MGASVASNQPERQSRERSTTKRCSEKVAPFFVVSRPRGADRGGKV